MSSTDSLVAQIPRLALRREGAAKAIDVSVDVFDKHVRVHLRSVRVGTLRLYPVAEIERYLTNQADEAAA
jgi:hypothetical protein